jgi:hypothetical protein
MKLKTGARFSILIGVAILILGLTAYSSFSQEAADFSKVDFAAIPNVLKFFDKAEGKVYLYSEVDGRLLATWTIDKLGQDLRRTGGTATTGY